MPIVSRFSNFYLDGEVAFMDGAALDHNPYVAQDEAAEEWRAGWLTASYAAMSKGAQDRPEAFGDLTTRFSSNSF
jgi:hypothetical protein